MAIKIEAGANVRRSDVFHVDPAEVVIRDELRGRRMAPGEDAIVAMASSLMEQGQLQPCLARRIQGNRIQLVAGFTRAAAARLLRDGFVDEVGSERRDEEFMLQVRVADMNDEDAFTRNVVENCRRNETSAIDDAHNQERLRSYGRSESEIARLYQCTPSKVCTLRKLLALDRDVQTLVHQGTMSVVAALDILELPDAAREKAIRQATMENGKVDGTTIRRQVRDHHLADAADPGEATAVDGGGSDDGPAPRRAAKPRSLKEIKAFFSDREWKNEKVAKLAKAIKKFVEGKSTEKYLAGVLEDLGVK